jgi:GT2 family glycosyltransferase
MSAVAVAIVSWNTRDHLARCLESLAGDADAGTAEVWVVDNASDDGSAELVRERFGWARLVASERNLGFGAAVNFVAARTESEFIAPANSDLRFAPGTIGRMLAVAADPTVGAVAPRLILPDGSTQGSIHSFPTLPFTLAEASGALRRSRRLAGRWPTPQAWDAERAGEVPWAVGAFLLVRREAWDAVGGFDEQQWMYAEDVDFCWRLAQAGWATRYEPLALVEHVEAAATSQHFGGERAPVWQRATYGCIARRKGLGYARVVALIYLFNVLSRTPAVYARSRDARWMRGAHRRWIATHLWALDPRRDLRRVR